MAPVAISSFTLKRSPMATLFLHLLLVVSSTLVVASCGEARMSDGSFMLQNPSSFEMGVASVRRELATTLNSTQSLSEDADVLLLFKAAITSDPFNVTRYWKPIGRRQLVNPCRPWVGITCTKRRVTAINLYNQSLGGTVPSVLGRLSQLKTLNLSTNFFSGAIPSELSLASSLETLDLGNNNLNDSLPPSLGDLRNLTALVVSANGLRGAIPTSISNLTSLRTLNFSGNSFSGTLAAGLATALGGLEVVDLSDNNLNGTLPVDIGNLRNLTVLDVGNNMLLGGLPATLGNCTSLSTLDVSGNPQLGGAIPSNLANLLRLRILHLAGSNLTGSIPQDLTTIATLTEIDMSSNTLTGAIPFQNLPNLTLLHLQNNRLEGDFITRVPTFPTLENLDVRNNQLTGAIPNGIGDVQFKTALLLGQNRLNGSIPEGLGQLTLVQRIDLSANIFSGNLPDAIKTCLSLTELNVSYNNLNGSLPTLTNLLNLKLFDASFNNFSGGVLPTFVNFTTLLSLNVSSNSLSGEVPFFLTHDNVTKQSFLNNTGLCGSVLSISCGSSDKLATSTITYIAIGSAAGLVVFLLLLFFLVTYCKGWNRKGSKHSSQVSAELQLKVTPDEILAATKEFNEMGYIGGGKLGTVYKGVLPDETVVAVKRLAISSNPEAKEEAEKALETELEVLGHVRHKSLVKVLGYCSSPETKALIMEYMPNGNLDSLLYPPQSELEVKRAFDWTVRFKIAVEIAEGLKYLHSESRQPVVHGDVKPSNILFDAKMEARVADFGVARILTEQGFSPSSSPSSSVATALGHKSPDVAASGTPSMKGDVYSFGIIMLEMMTGRSPYTLEDPSQTLPQWVRATVSNCKALQNVLDPQLLPDLPSHQQKMAMVLGVALLCTRNQPQERPHMDEVHKMLAHIRSKPSGSSSRRKGILMLSSGRRRSRSAASSEVHVQPPQPSLPHTPSLSDWTPPSQV